MSIALPSMIGLMPIGDLSKERSRIFGQWMECKPIDNDATDLDEERQGSGRIGKAFISCRTYKDYPYGSKQTQ
jgi:hypothetical protein